DLLRIWQHLQDVVDQSRKIVDDGDRGLVVGEWRVTQVSLVYGSEQQRSLREKLAPVLTHECSCRPADAHHQVRGRTIGVKGSDVVDRRLVGSADKSRGPDDHWNDVDRFPDALVQLHAEIPDELIENQ